MASRALPPKLAAVMARILAKCGPLPPSTVATLPYLVDVVATHVLGRPITEGTHVCMSDEQRTSIDKAPRQPRNLAEARELIREVSEELRRAQHRDEERAQAAPASERSQGGK